MKKNILVTGAYGFIGKKLFTKLLKIKKFKTLGIGRKKNNQNILKHVYKGNINDRNLKNIKIWPHTIIHCAGKGNIKLNVREKTNDIKAINNLINFYSKKPPKKFILISSAAVYGGIKKLKPISDYGKQKLKVENICKKFFSKKRTKLKILRVYSIYGPGLRKQLIWDVCKKLKYNKHNYFGSGKEVRSWVYIDDLINIILRLIDKNTKKNVIDIHGNNAIKNEDLLKLIYKLSCINLQKPVFTFKTRNGDPKIMRSYKTDKLPFVNYPTKLEAGLRNYIKWFKKQKI